jgi:sugar phosphate isomerase/epimerase
MAKVKTNVAFQTYTIRDFLKTPKDIAQSMRRVRQIGYEVLQLSGVGPIPDAELKKILDGEGLGVCTTHEDFKQMQTNPQMIIDKYRLFGARHAAIGGMPQEYRSGEGFVKFAKDATAVGQTLAEGGLTFCYHNHNFEFEKFRDRNGFQILYAESDPRYFKAEPDTYWIQAGGGDPAYWLATVSKRAPLLHLKDMAMKGHSQQFAEVGEGNLNWPAIFRVAKEVGVEWYIVEQDTHFRNGDPFESAAISLKNIRAMAAKGMPGLVV